MSLNCIKRAGRSFVQLLSAALVVALLGACSFTPKSKAPKASVAATTEAPAAVRATAPVAAAPLPKDLPREYREALQLMQSGRYAEAIAPLEKLTRAQNGWSGPYTNLGIAYAQLGQNDAAIQALEQAVLANPGSAAAHNQLGILYRTAGRFDDARKAYEAALAADANYALAHRNLGILYDLYLQQPAKALPHYQACAELANLSGEEDKELALWIAEIKQRAGGGQ